MRILITNDDGVGASELPKLISACRKYGEVTAVVPKFEQSGKSHGIEIHKAFEAKKVDLVPDVTVWAVDSTPADCVRFAVLGLKLEFDLVISGINRGLNIGTDVMYSGTVGAAFEANSLGIKALSVSTPPEYYERAILHLDDIFAYIEKNKLLEENDIYNINIPCDPGEILITHQGGPYYSDDFIPVGNDMYMPHGKSIWCDSRDDSLDTDAALHGYISVTPLTICRTDMDVYSKLKKLETKKRNG